MIKNFTRKTLFHLGTSSLIMVLSLLIFSPSQGQSTLTVGTGTSTTYSMPFYSYYYYSYSQQIYLQSEINAAGGAPGSISKIRFYYSSGSNTSGNNWDVYIGHTNKTSFSNSSDWIDYNDLTQVYSGSINYPGGGNWVEINLTTPFSYNGSDNLVIAVDENSSGGWQFTYWQYTSTSNTRAIYYGGFSNPDPANPPTNTSYNHTFNGYNNLQFDISFYPACTGTPTAGNTTAASDTICMGETAWLGIQNQNSFDTITGISYQWQTNASGTWADLAGDTLSEYETDALFSNTDYRCVVTCDSSGQSDTSTAITIHTITPDSVNVTPGSYAFCSGSSVNLTATTNGGNASFSWSPSNGLNTTSGATVTANPSETTAYTVMATDSNGCVTSAEAAVAPITAVKADIITVPENICSSGSSVVLGVDGYPTALSGSGNWEFQWSDTAGNVLMPWSSFGYYYTINPTVDGEYNYLVNMRSTSCPSDSLSQPLKAKITVGFGADVDTTQVNCLSPLGAFDLYNVFGQTQTDTAFEVDFGAGTNSAVTYFGSAVLDGNKAACTPSATGISGGVILDPPSTPALGNGFTVHFDLTVDQPINNYGTGGADGFTYSFADDVSTTSSSYHNGTGSKLRVSFDAAGNSSSNGNAVGIYLVYGWNSTTAFGPTSSEVLAYSTNSSLWKGQVEAPVTLEITNAGEATLSVNGVIVFDHVQLPASYLNEDISNWKHAFTAATGGDAERHAVNDVVITKEKLQYGITAGANTTSAPTAWQASTHFSGLTPGFYHLWISNPSDATCNKDLGVFEIKNTYPVVDLGNDTTICEGDSLTLDAGSGLTAYLWSPSNWTLQTLTVDEAGTYAVSVTDSVGCSAMASIDVEIAEDPVADNIFASGNDYVYSFFVVNPENVGSYYWDFGDGNTQANGSSFTTHTYNDTGSYTVMVVLNSEFGCGTDTIYTDIYIARPLGVENTEEGTFQFFPNPANETVTFNLGTGNNYNNLQVYNVSGQLIFQNNVLGQNQFQLNVSEWNNGVYFIHLHSDHKDNTIKRLVINH